MKTKILGILVMMLLIATATSVASLKVEHNEKQLCRIIQNRDSESLSVSGCMPSSFTEFEASDLYQKMSTHNEVSLQSVDGDIIEMIQALDELMYLGYLEDLVAFGPRVTGTNECEEAGTYIYNEFESMGLDVRYQEWSYEGYQDKNIEATLPGIDETSNEIYIISAHHDSLPGSPGADNGGSGVAAMLSAAYITSQYSFDHTLRFVSFSGDCVGMYGSHKYAEESYGTGDNILGVLNADIMGYADTEVEFNNIFIAENPASQWLTTFMDSVSQQYDEYINLGIQRSGAWEGWSDHSSFWEFGYDAIWFANVAYSPYQGGPADTIENLNIEYAVKGSKLLLATLAELANSNMGSIPKKPSVTGPEEGEIGEELSFSTSTIDPYTKQLRYLWDWGDGTQSEWLGPIDSGATVTASYSWDEKGIYQVKVKARNSDELESDWSNPFIVGIPKKNDGTDQQQTEHGNMGYGCWYGGQFAQSFIPTKKTITKVSLYLFKVSEPLGLTVSIRDDLNGGDLTSAYLLGSDIKGEKKAGWYDFNFPEIEVTPGDTYYIIWTPDDNNPGNVIYWMYGNNNPYPNGRPWNNVGYIWEEFEIPDSNNGDFCFKTYYAKSKSNVINVNPFFLQFLENHPRMFPLIRQLLRL